MNNKVSSIKSLLTKAASLLQSSSDSPLLDSEVILCWLLEKPRSYLRAWSDSQLDQKQCKDFWALIEQRQKGIPVAYITGKREFWSREFMVSKDVLIPRPDTELLIELSLNLIPDNKGVKLLDLGTGSGIIAITLAAERPLLQVTACDFSAAALDIAKHNASKHQLDNILFFQSDWFKNIPENKFRLIVSNPPYIAGDDVHLHKGDLRFEPQSALIATENGLGDIKNIAQAARQYLDNGGHLLIEHGYQQQQAVQAIFKHFNYHSITTHTDLSGQPRVTYGQWSNHDTGNHSNPPQN